MTKTGRMRIGTSGGGRWSALAAGGLGLAAAGTLAARAWRTRDEREVRQAWAQLSRLAAQPLAAFAPEMTDGLPEPARRYLRYAITPGTLLRRVAEIEMGGWFGLGDRERPRYLPMRAREILAPPEGFVWTATLGSGATSLSGSDASIPGAAWTRFRLLGVVPIVRAATTPDLVRSATARAFMEAIWVPAALLPQNGVRWEPVDVDRARAVLERPGERFAFELTVAADGRPLSLTMQRWSNANRERAYRFQPFGGTVEEIGAFGGYRVPVRLSVGNHVGTADYFPFFRAEVREVRYL